MELTRNHWNSLELTRTNCTLTRKRATNPKAQKGKGLTLMFETKILSMTPVRDSKLFLFFLLSGRLEPGDTQRHPDAPRRHPGDIQETSRRHPADTQETPKRPRRHPEAPRRHPRDTHLKFSPLDLNKHNYKLNIQYYQYVVHGIDEASLKCLQKV